MVPLITMKRDLHTTRKKRCLRVRRLLEFEEKRLRERDENQLLLASLNSKRGKYRQIVRLIHLLWDLRQVNQPLTLSEFLQRDLYGSAQQRRSWKLVREINKILTQYAPKPRIKMLKLSVPLQDKNAWERTRVRISGDGGGDSSQQQDKYAWKRTRVGIAWDPGGDSPKTMVRILVQRIEEDSFHYLAECLWCKTFIFARRLDQRFCSRDCRWKHYRTTDEGKRSHAEAMRRYRGQPCHRRRIE